ncbi:thiopeptide-type bacteriocin biosynthesis protein [Chitinophaga japonensis]|uniref:Thiopeptide-type bacteriocin biosynthesis protein n=1 Tax=Chitinophaga japonensis TaxID=104662 RepID=A0A562SST0_CHIJA|nr:thiopeptide-type bacteriocin biosynthesis protein [Chitinophaga japonensis]TWI84193.1 thiopeptide-type bacteriocin biosynthesis protein [Chitinophaga japonensis]
MENVWLSAHLFYAGHPHVLLNQLVTPLLQSSGLNAFFIRYWDGGPHIRLRIHVKAAAVQTVKALQEAAARSFFAQHPSQRDDTQYRSRPLLPNDTLQYIPYQPETERYGNAQSIGWAEQQFIASSRYVLQHIHDTPDWDNSVALLHAIRLNMALLYALREEEASALDICRHFIQGWLPRLYGHTKDAQAKEQHYMQMLHDRFAVYAPALTAATFQLWREMEQDNAEPHLQTFIAHNREIFCQYRALGFTASELRPIIGSFMHMGHNRLGISNLDEAYIMFFTLKCMEHIYAGMDA